MSSHREAPEISKDPVADNADVYAFVSPDRPETVTIISNFVPLQNPSGGPNFYEFGDDVLYSIYVDNDGDAQPEIEYQFQFTTTLRNPNTFLYNTGQITSLDSPSWNKRQFYSVTRIDAGPPPPPPKHGPGGPPPPPPGPPGPPAAGGPAFPPGPTHATVLGSNLPCPPCNIGPRSTPSYDALAAAAVQTLATGETVFCGQRNDGFFVDLGGVFDLGDLRPFQSLHLISTPNAAGVDDTKSLNIHTIAIQIPISMLTRDGSTPTNVLGATAVLGIWSGASRRKVRMIDGGPGDHPESGPWVQVSRLGNPLFNEVIVPLGKKDEWNGENPADDAEYLPNVEHPELARLIPVLYPNVFPNLAGLTAPRADLVAILLTGLPAGVVPGFQNTTGSRYADMLRLNVAVPPAVTPNPLGLVGGDAAGFPNGRRVFDDVVTVELRAIAGLTYPLVDPGYTPDGAAALIDQGVGPGAGRYLDAFPYLGSPHDGFDTPSA
jgi:Domain of unknown function (DUF4331)